MKEEWKMKLGKQVEGKEKKVLSFMIAFLVLGLMINIIISFVSEKESFEIKVKETNTSIPFPLLPNEMSLGGGITKIQELKKVEQELEIMMMQETLSRQDSLKLLYYYEYLTKNR